MPKKLIKFFRGFLHLIKPKFSFHYVSYLILFLVISFSTIQLIRSVSANTPNPGHAWNEVGNGNFAVNDNTFGAVRTFTFPNASATVLTTNDKVTVAQGGTGADTLTGILLGNGTSAVTALALTSGQSIRMNAGGSAYEAFTPGTGTVTAVSVVSANGFAGTSGGGATPALTLTTSISGMLKGNGTAISAATDGTDYLSSSSGWKLNGQALGAKKTLGSTDAYDIGFLTSNSERLTILSGGNVGVGTTTAALGHLQITDTGTSISRGLTVSQHNSGIQGSLFNFYKSRGTESSPLTVANGDYGGLFIFKNYDGTAYRSNATWGYITNGTIGTNSIPGQLFFAVSQANDDNPYTNGSVRMVIGSDGNVGIGTTAPTSLLALGGTAARTIQMERNTTAATAGQGLTLSSGGAIAGTNNLAGGDLNLKSGISTGTGTSDIHFFTATAGSTGAVDNTPTEKMTILGNGNVGIGTTTPAYKFDVNGDVYTGGTAYINSQYLRILNSSNTLILDNGVNGGDIHFKTYSLATGQNNFIFKSSGNVGIGDTSPDGTLDIDSTITTGIDFGITNTGIYTGTGIANITANSLTSGTLFSLASSGASQTSAKYIDIAQTGVTTGFTGSLINLTSSSTTGAANFINLTANSSTLGVGEKISMTALTGGTGLSITGGSAMIAGGELIDLQMGAATVGNAINIVNSGAYTGTGLLNITANALTTGTAINIPHTTSVIANGGSLMRLSSTSVDTSTTTGVLLDLSSTASTAGTQFLQTYSGLTTGIGQSIVANALSSGTLLSLSSNGTAGATNQKGLNIALAGINGTAAQTTYGAYISNTHAGTTSTNVGLYATATGGTTANYAAIFAAGNVGIGTTAPTGKLTVSSAGGANGGINLTTTSGSSYAPIDFNTPSGLLGQFLATGSSFSNQGFGGEELVLAAETTTAALHLAAIGSSGYIKFTTGGLATTNERMRITSNGNVGISTTSPTNILSLGGTAARTIWMERNTTAATAGQGLTLSSGGAIAGTADLAGGDLTLKSGISTGTGDSAMHFFTATAGTTGITDRTPTEKMTILGSGYVGIGTTNPTAKFQVETTGANIFVVNTGGLTDTTGGIFTGFTKLLPTAADQRLGVLAFGSRNGADDNYYGANVGAFSEGAWTAGVSYPTYLTIGLRASGSILNTERFRITSAGNVGIGTTSPTAVLHLKAGTASANTAPLKFTSGTNLTTAEAGAIEYDGTELYFTPSGTTRETIAYTTDIPITVVNSSNLFSTGISAGDGVTSTTFSNFFGVDAGDLAYSASGSNFIGYQAGNSATNALNSNFIGYTAGVSATDASHSNFIGYNAGDSAVNASHSVFLGTYAGKDSANASNSIFIGKSSGISDTVDNTASTDYWSILIGYNTNTGGYSNSILLGGSDTTSSISNTKSNQFMLADMITDVRWRGVEYSLPPAQGGSNEVLTNDGSGGLSWSPVAAGSVNWDAIGNPIGNGAIAMGSTVQTMDWATATTTNPLSLTAAALTSGKLFSLTSNSLTSGTLLDITSAGTAGLTNQKGLNIALSGTNATSAQTTYGTYISNTHAGTTSTNVGLYATAAGGTTANYAAIFDAGRVVIGGIGGATPTVSVSKFQITNEETTAQSAVQITSYYDGVATQGQILNVVSRGTALVPSAIQADDIMGGFAGRGRASTSFVSTAKVKVIGAAAENWTDSANGTYVSFLTTPIGSSTISEKVRITGSGNIGMGTTSPTNILSLGGTAAQTIWMERNTTAATAGQGLTLSSGGAIAGTADLAGGDLNLKSGISTGTGTSDIHFFTATAGTTGITDRTPTEKMTILGNGNVGIGTTNPIGKLNVGGITYTNNRIGIVTDLANPTSNKIMLIDLNASNYGRLQAYDYGGTVGLPLILNDAGGNVGIGTTAPTSLLALGGATARTIQMERNTTAATAGQGLTLSSGGAIAGTADLAGGDLTLKSGISTGTGTSDIHFFTATAGSTGVTDNTPTEKMTILGSGHVLIGGTTLYTPIPAPLQITNDSAVFGNMAQPPILAFNYSDSGAGGILALSAKGTKASPTALTANVVITGFSGRGAYDTSGTFSGNRVGLLLSAEESWSSTAQGTFISFKTTNSGTVVIDERMRITGSGNLGIGTTAPTSLLALGGTAARTIQMERNTTAATAGQGLTLSSGGAIAGTNNLAGGDLTLKSGISTGTGTSDIHFFTATAGSTGVTDNTPTEKMTILGSGYVGIGTTTPLAQIHIVSSSQAQILERISSDTTAVGLDFRKSRGSIGGQTAVLSGDILMNISSKGYDGSDYQVGSRIRSFVAENWSGVARGSYLVFDTTSIGSVNISERMRISDVGNLGIGTTSPTNILSLGGTAARTIWVERNTTAATAGQGLTLSSGGAIAGTADLAGGDLTLQSGISTGTGTSALRFFTATAGSTGVTDNTPTEKMTILGSGYVGIGTTGPVDKLSVEGVIGAGSVGGVNGEIRSYQSSGNYVSLKTDTVVNRSGIYRSNAGFFNFYDTNTGDVGIDAQFSGANLVFQIGSQEKMRVANSGNVGIGDTSPDGTLDIDSAITTGINFGITNTGIYTGTGIVNITANSATTGTVGLITANGLSSGSMLSLSSNGTAGLTNQKGLNIALAGTNGTAAQTTYGAYISNTHAGTTSTNVGLYVTASSGTTANYAAIFNAGSVGIGDTTPDGTLDIDSAITTGINFGITNTGIYTGTGIVNITANSATTGTVGLITANGLSSGSMLSLSSNGTAGLTNQKGLNIALAGTNGTAAQTTYGAYISNTHAGTTSTNVGLYATATGGTTANYAAIFAAGNVGIGTTAPTNILSLGGTAARTIWMERNTTAATAGQGLTLSSGGAIAGTNNLAGGDLNLKSGISTGTGTSAMHFFTATAGTTGATDNTPTEKMTILGSGDIGISFTTPKNTIPYAFNGVAQDRVIEIRSENGSGDSGVFIRRSDAVTGLDLWQESGGNGQAYIDSRFDNNVGGLTFRVKSAATTPLTALRILGSGLIGVGTVSPSTILEIGSSDLGDGVAGPVITLGRNTNATNTGAGSIDYLSKGGTHGYVWQDNAGVLRINTSAPSNANDTLGTIVGTQSSTRDTKQDINDYTDYSNALAMVVNAPLHTFRYIKEVNGYGTDSPLAKVRIGYIADEVDPVFMVGNSIDQVSVNGILMASIKEMNLKFTEINNFEKENTWRDNLIAWFANAENRITRIFTGEVCLTEAGEETVCLNREELKSLKELLNQTNNNNGGGTGGGGSDTTTCNSPQILVNNICVDPVNETCSDGIKNQDETDIDVGGVCDTSESSVTETETTTSSDASSDTSTNTTTDTSTTTSTETTTEVTN